MKPEAFHTLLVTLVTAVSAGVLLMALARRLQVSAIVLLLLGGVALGPEGLGLVRPDTLGSGLPMLVTLPTP